MEMKLMSESVGNLAAALSAAQGEFEPCKRTAVNPFFKSKYSPLDEVVAATQPALTKNGIAVSQQVVTNGTMQLVTYLMHKSGEFIGGTYPIAPTKNDPQGIGSALTYARRYALMAALGVPAEDDDGQQVSAPVKSAPVAAKPQPKPTPAPAKVAPVENLPFPENEAATEEVTDEPQELPDGVKEAVGILNVVCAPRAIGKGTKHSIKVDDEYYMTWSNTLAAQFAALKGKPVFMTYKWEAWKSNPEKGDNVLLSIAEAEA